MYHFINLFFCRKEKFSLFLLAFLVFFFLNFVATAQTDTRFWFAAPDITTGHYDRPVRIVVSAFDQPATVTITQPANLAFPTYIVIVPVNSSRSIDITASMTAPPAPGVNLVETPFSSVATPIRISTTGLLVESTAKITAYYEVNYTNVTNNPDIFALKGNNALGNDFYVPFQNTWRHRQGITPAGRSGFVIVATEDSTTVTVTPTRVLEGGQAANMPFNFILNKGETYVASVSQPTAGGFPSGSRVQSNKPVAVTKFSDSMHTGTDASPSGCFDLAGDQLVPVSIIGRNYVVLRGRLGIVGTNTSAVSSNAELAVVTATQHATQVRVNGTLVATLNSGQTYTHRLTIEGQKVFINTTEPAYVGHYAGYGCEVGFAILPPVDCTGSLTTRIVRSAGGVDDDFTINLMTRGLPTGGTPSANSFDFTNNFTIKVTNGGTTTTLFAPAGTVPGPTPPPPFPATFTQVGTSEYYGTQYTFSTAQVPIGAVVTIENTTISAADPAGLFHLGFVNGGSSSGTRYGYFSGFRALDLGADVNINYGTNTTITADIQATNFEWFVDGVSAQNGMSNTFIVNDIQRRQTVRVDATVGNCVVSDDICVGTNEYVWDGSINDPITGLPDIDNSDNWSKPCGQTGTPKCNIDIIIPPTPIAANSLTVQNGQTLNVRNLSILSSPTVKGNLIVKTGGQVNVCGDMVHNGLLTMEKNSTFKFVGTGRQNYSKGTRGEGDFENLVIENTIGTSTFNNVAGLTILSSSVQDLSVSTTGTLQFARGYIVPEGFPTANGVDNSKSVVIKNPNPNAITGFNTVPDAITEPTDYFVAGKLNRAKNATDNYSFPVGLVLQEPSTISPEPTKNGSMTAAFANTDWQSAAYPTGITCVPSPNGVLSMNSNSKYVDFGGNTGNIGVAGNASRTIEIWARPTAFNGGGLFQFGSSTALNGDFALVTIDRNSVSPVADNNWGIRLNNGFALDLINLANSLNSWNHYALIYDGATQQLSFFYNGQRMRTYNLPAPLATVLTNGQLGRWSGNSGTTFRGQVDELKVWSEVRTEAQIKASFTQGCAANALVCPQANNLKAYYNFQDGILNGTATRTIQSRTIQCPEPTFSYQRADANFNVANSVNNVTASFKKYQTVPLHTGQTNICNGNFNTNSALNNGFWNFSSFNASNAPVAVNSDYQMYLFNRDYTNSSGVSTTVMQLPVGQNPYGASPPWTIPPGLCLANTPPFTGRSGFTGNMGFFGTAQSLDPTLLPIELLSLSAKPVDRAILVEWATLQELDNYGFEVFRAEEEGDFVKIGFVSSKQQGQTRQDYNFLDVEVRPNITYYYQLKQIDTNGKFSFTKVVSAKISGGSAEGFEQQTTTLYPNPTEDEFTLYLGGQEFRQGTKVEISLVNAIGEELERRTINTQAGKSITFKLDKYPNGLYLLRIVGESSATVIKVVKE